MSHLLHLRPAAPGDWPRVVAFFEGRRGYRPGERGFGYANEDTGVSFALLRSDDHFELEINYGRPRFFGLEATEELRALSRVLPVEMRDPQSSGRGGEWRPLDPDAFFRDWLPGNVLAARYFTRERLSRAPQLVPAEAGFEELWKRTTRAASEGLTVDSLQLERIWRWNYTARAREAESGRCVPRIVLALMDDAICTVARLDEGRPALLPDGARIWVSQPTLAPATDDERLRAQEAAEREDGLIEAHDVDRLEPFMSGAPVPAGLLPAYAPLGDQERSAELTLAVNQLCHSGGATLQLVPFSAVMDVQLLRESDGVRTLDPDSPTRRRTPEPEPVGATRLGRLVRKLGHERSLLKLEIRSALSSSTADLEAAFRRSPEFNVRDGVLHYENTDTGAHFGFERGEYALRIAIDFCTPTPFIEELLLQFERVKEPLALLMREIGPTEFPEFRPYLRSRFAELWVQAMPAKLEAVELARIVGQPLYAASKQVLDRVHLWNLRRRSLEASLGLEVPRIAFSYEDGPSGGMKTFVRWTRLGPVVLPAVDSVRIPGVLPREVYPDVADAAEEDQAWPGELAPDVTDVLEPFDQHVEVFDMTPPLPPHFVLRHEETLARIRARPATMSASEGLVPSWSDAPEVPFADLVPVSWLDHPQQVEANHCLLPDWDDDVSGHPR